MPYPRAQLSVTLENSQELQGSGGTPMPEVPNKCEDVVFETCLGAEHGRGVGG